MKLRDAITAGVKPLAQNRLRARIVHSWYLHRDCGCAVHDRYRRWCETHHRSKTWKMMGGANQNRILDTDYYLERAAARSCAPTERYTLKDASAIEAECPDVLYVLPKVEDFNTFVSSRSGNQSENAFRRYHSRLRSPAWGWELQVGRFLTRNDIETRSAGLCPRVLTPPVSFLGKHRPSDKR